MTGDPSAVDRDLVDVPIVDVHVHMARLATMRVSRERWELRQRDGFDVRSLYDEEGTPQPDRLAAYLAGQGVETCLLMAEYSPKVTGIQPVEDLLPFVRHDPSRFGFIAALNPHYHHPLVDELERQVGLGARAVKIHPVHGGFPADAAELFPVYWVCQQREIPVVFHCGTSTFPGADNRFGDPAAMENVARNFPRLTMVLAHGGRGWWYDAAAFMALARPTVWIDLAGLPPRRLPEYYRSHDLERLARRWIFGSDWPGAPGIRSNATELASIGLSPETLRRLLRENAREVYRLT